MAASDIMVNASAPEPFGLVIVEAMAAGCAVVAVASGGPRDIIEDGISGVLCATREPRELAEAIQRLLDDVGLRRDIGRAARARVEAEFTREAMADRFADIIRAVA
jgi:glycosyltransferase involved in cell wall biosynthesis